MHVESVKRCNICGEVKPLDDFHKSSSRKDGRQGRCKACNIHVARAWRKGAPPRADNAERGRRQRLSKYGMTLEEFESIADGQSGKCSLCDEVPTKLVVDHDHETGIVRGLICDPCNRGLGAFRDDPIRLKRAIQYLAAPPLLGLAKMSRYGVKSEVPHAWLPGRKPRGRAAT